MLKNVLIFTLASVVFACAPKKQQVDLLILDANIYTVDSSFSKVSAMAIDKGKIIETGSAEQINQKYQSEQTLSLKGKTILPGLIDAHCHFTGYATDLWKCNLVATKSYNEVIDRIVTYSKTAPLEWIYGRG